MWLTSATKQRNTEAQNSLGLCAKNGDYVLKTYQPRWD